MKVGLVEWAVGNGSMESYGVKAGKGWWGGFAGRSGVVLPELERVGFALNALLDTIEGREAHEAEERL